jgi:hypothetical protein
MKSKILDAVHHTTTGIHKSGAITDATKMEFDKLCLQPAHQEDTESFLAAVTGKLSDDFPDDITDDDFILSRKPGAWSDLPTADVDWVAPISLLEDPDTLQSGWRK